LKYDAIFFDVGNTLFFYNCEFLKEFVEDRFGCDLIAKELEKTYYMLRKDVLAGAFSKLDHDGLWREFYRRWLQMNDVDEEIIPNIIDAIRDHPFNHMFWSKMEEGTREMIDWFRERGLKTGIISNADGQIQRLVDHVDLSDRFDVVIDSGLLGFEKPDERIFKHATSSIDVDPKRSIHVGDLFDVDVVGARGVGMIPVLIDPDGRGGDNELITIARAVDLPTHPFFSGL